MENIIGIRVQIVPGTSITEAAASCLKVNAKLSAASLATVWFSFNGIKIAVKEKDTVTRIVDKYNQLVEKFKDPDGKHFHTHVCIDCRKDYKCTEEECSSELYAGHCEECVKKYEVRTP